MGDRLRFHPLVADDLSDATGWYDAISAELGNRFRHAVNLRLDSIEQYPESFGAVSGELRAARVGGFPYLVLFEHADDVTQIIGIYHVASNPHKWRSRKRP